MNNTVLVSEVFGWMSLINIGLLSLATLALMWMGERVTSVHGRLFGIPAQQLKTMYMNYLAHYKLLIFIFNLVPYIALKILF
jgi:Zn-dependent protease